MNIMNSVFEQDEQKKKESLNGLLRKPKVAFVLGIILSFVIIFIVLALIKTTTYLSSSSTRHQAEKGKVSVVKGSVATQAPSVPGQPIKWTTLISASTISAGQHLIEIPKSAGEVKVQPVVRVGVDKKITTSSFTSSTQSLLSTSPASTLTKTDRQKLKELSRQNAISKESLALAESLKIQKNIKLQQVYSQRNFFSRFVAYVSRAFSKLGSSMASVATAVEETVVLPTPPQPEVTVVDVLPQAEVEAQTKSTAQTQTDPATTDNTTNEQGSTTETSQNTAGKTSENGGVGTGTGTSTTETSSANTESTLSTSTSGDIQVGDGGTNIINTTATSSTNLSTSTKISTTKPTSKTTDVIVEYQTPAPTLAEAVTDTGKIVTVSDSAGEADGQPHTQNVLAFTNIPPIYKVGQENKIKIKWLNNNGQDMQFHAYDLDGDGKLDYVEWTVPHLSTQTFEIIFITKALELDENGEITGDIYDLVKDQDNTWATIADGHTVRVTFEKFLTNKNDNTIYARPTRAGVQGTSSTVTSARIDVYPVYDGTPSEQPVVTFGSINAEKMSKVLLMNLHHSTNTFDLKTTGSVDIDYIVDPTPITITDTFHATSRIASSNNVVIDTATGQITLAASSSWACGSALLDTRDGKTYTTVLIGSQCWMQQNLNVGTMVTGATTQGTSCATAASIQKYCYANDTNNCISGGGLYQWTQVMCGGTTPGAKGICPTGWHVPTHDEFTTLERTTCTSGSCVTDFPYDTTTTGWRGTNEGTTMRNMSGSYRGFLSGYRNTDGSFYNLGTDTHFWSSVASGTTAWYHYLYSGNAGVNRNLSTKAYGFSVRCLKD